MPRLMLERGISSIVGHLGHEHAGASCELGSAQKLGGSTFRRKELNCCGPTRKAPQGSRQAKWDLGVYASMKGPADDPPYRNRRKRGARKAKGL